MDYQKSQTQDTQKIKGRTSKFAKTRSGESIKLK